MNTRATPSGEPSPFFSDGAGAPSALMDKLREANQNLVLATLEAQALKEEAEDARTRQQEYLAMLAHELRNPLGAIKTAATLLERLPDVPPQAQRLQEIIARQASHMAALLNDLLDAALINSHKVRLETQCVALDAIMKGAIEAAQPRLEAHGQHLAVDLPQTRAAIMGDAARLVQIFSNLLGNASKFTPAGGNISVRATVDDAWIEVMVSDDGSGMDPELLPHIFELFTQGPRALARSEGGLGIGLNVVRNLVELHGGTVQAESPGADLGSTFTVRLPRAPGGPAPEFVNSEQKQHAPLKILLLEDNDDARATLQALLEADGHAVTVGASGTAGLQQLRDEPCDLLVCDVGLPCMDGIALIKQVRATLPDRVGIAIAISGYGDAATRSKALAAGFDGYMVKPVDMQALMNLFDSLSSQRA